MEHYYDCLLLAALMMYMYFYGDQHLNDRVTKGALSQDEVAGFRRVKRYLPILACCLVVLFFVGFREQRSYNANPPPLAPAQPSRVK